MDFEKSSLYQEVLSIQNSDPKTQYRWGIQIHIDDTDYDVMKLISIDDVRDFELTFAPEIMLEVTMSGGMYAYDIYPNKDDLEITVTQYPLNEVGDTPNPDLPVMSERFRAVLKDAGNAIIEANQGATPTRDTLDLTVIQNVKFQLIDLAVEQLRLITIGGIYRGGTVQDVITSVLTNESAKIDVPDANKVKGVDMVDASNEKPRDHILLPHGIPLVTVPEYIHEKCGGVYSAGMGYFFQDDYWYVYPCFDTGRYDDAEYSFTVINVPRNKFVQVERTYRQDGDNLVIMATGEVKFRDDSNRQQLNAGNGVRFTDADNILTGFTKNSGNKSIAARAQNNNEFISVKREDGNNNARLSDTPITANAYVEYSKLARRNGGVFAFTWENSDPSLIKPGMMAKIMYLQEDDIITIYGVLLKVASYHHMAEVGVTSTRYRTNTALSIFIKRVTSGSTT